MPDSGRTVLRRPRLLPWAALVLSLAPAASRSQEAAAGGRHVAGPRVVTPPRPASLSTGRAVVRQAGFETSIAPLQGARDVAAFYAYDTPVASCANTGLETSETSLMFLYEDTSVAPSALSIVFINDDAPDATGGAADFDIAGLPAASVYAVKDDAPDGYAPDPPSGGQTRASWSWGTCCTDGAALDGLETDSFCIAVTPAFTSGILAWQVLDGPDAAAPVRTRLPSLADTAYICGDCQILACPGVVNAACAAGGTGWADLRILGSSKCGGEVITNDRTPGGADASGFYPVGTTTVTFTLVDVAGFTSSCSTDIVVQDDTSPPVITTCPAPLTLDCAGMGDIPASDPRIAAWLATFQATDACGPVRLSDDATAFPAGCHGTTTPVTFHAVDAAGHDVSCVSSVTVAAECFGVPDDVGAALRVRNHGDPYAADITATFDWTRDAGLPRPPGEHYHVLRGTDPRLLSQVSGMEPWPALTFDESTPAAAARPFVHFYSVVAASPCEDVSAD